MFSGPVVMILVHPGLLWVEIESSAVEEDCGFEVLSVTEAADASFDGHDLAVDSFGNCVGNSMCMIRHDVLEPLLERASKIHHRS